MRAAAAATLPPEPTSNRDGSPASGKGKVRRKRRTSKEKAGPKAGPKAGSRKAALIDAKGVDDAQQAVQQGAIHVLNAATGSWGRRMVAQIGGGEVDLDNMKVSRTSRAPLTQKSTRPS